jgi:RNA polymerase sigma factor (sigma-70 family)
MVTVRSYGITPRCATRGDIVDDLDLEWCLARSAEGDQVAWGRLVTRFSPLLWAVARAHRLSDADAADVVQGTWLRLVENLGRIREPERVGAWLATTCRRECLAVLRRGSREQPAEQDRVVDLTGADHRTVDADLLRRERDARLWSVFEGLSDPCRRLLRALLADPAPSYDEVSAALGMPIGSIGPTRGRCLRQLHTLALEAGISREDLTSVSPEELRTSPAARSTRGRTS